MRLTHGLKAGRRCSAVLALLAVTLLPALSEAQANSGALDLTYPIGARATSMGTAFVAEQGSEAAWWNPAGLARMTKPEFGLDHFETFFIKGDAASFVIPAKPIGVFAISARIFDYGPIEGTDTLNNPLGEFPNRTIVLGASFAADFGSAFDAGVSYHLYRGQAGLTPGYGTSAVDAGIQYRPSPTTPLRIGFEIRNFGLPLQVHDKPQSDELPTRLHLGASYDPTFSQLPKELATRVTAEVVGDQTLQNLEVRLGGQLSYAAGTNHLLIRAGYVKQQVSSALTGPSLGLGLTSGRVQLDLARIFESFSTGLGTAPTYISIRVGL